MNSKEILCHSPAAKVMVWPATDSKIWHFLQLEEGWNFGEGVGFSQDVVAKARYLNSLLGLNGFVETDAFPGLNGEIRVTAYWKTDYFEFTLESGGVWVFRHERNGEEADCRVAESLTDLFFIVSLLGRKVCSSSASCQQGGTGILDSKDFRVWLSGPAPMEESRCFTKTAHWKSRQEFANTSSGTTRESQASHQFFGSLIPA